MPGSPWSRWPARPTVVLVVAAGLALVLALVMVDRSPPAEPRASAAPSPSPSADAGLDVDPGVVAAALDRVEAIDQPLTTWLQLADCESGEWDADADPVPGSADWTYGSQDDVRFEGGLHFEPSTWDAFRDPGMAEHAGDAAPVAQMVVAERVLDAQGWTAWPVCSRKLGLR